MTGTVSVQVEVTQVVVFAAVTVLVVVDPGKCSQQ